MMEPRAPVPSLGIYKETWVDLEPSHPNSIIHIQLSSTSSFARTTRLQRKVLSALPASKGEEDFKRQHIASSSSLYFRTSNKYPRSFLWRCLEDDTTLELRSVDLSKDEYELRDATLVFRITFPSAIRRGGIALADNAEQDVLSVFVLTKANEIYTLTLRPDFFCRLEASEDEFGRWCHTFKPSSFSISIPHRMIACSSLELLVSLGDGRLMRLSRKLGDDGSKWREAAYNDGQWGSSLRGFIPWQGTTTVRYDGQLLDQNTAVAAHSSPDHKHLLVVSINHTLKAWNIATGRPTFTRDLLDKQREPQDIPKVLLDPGTSKVMQIFESYGLRSGDRYYIATFSPQHSGLFKFWGLRDADFAETGVRDLFPDNALKVPDPDDGAIWTMADFNIKASRGSTDVEIWILVRLNRRYKLFSKKSTLENLAVEWEDGWSSTVTQYPRRLQSSEPAMKISELDPEDAAEKWLDFALSPGRVPETVLEAALATYRQTRDSPSSNVAKPSLKERIASSVGSQVERKAADINLTKFRDRMHMEWTHFWSIVCDLDQNRCEPLSLGYDEHTESPWLAFADGCSAIRFCGEIERLFHNTPVDLQTSMSMFLKPSIESDQHSTLQQLGDLALLISLAARFRESFSADLQYSSEFTLKQELWQDSLFSAPIRMQLFYDRCSFADEISQKQYDSLVKGLMEIGGPEALTTDLIMSLLDLLLQPMSTNASGLVSTNFGLKVLVKGAQEMIALHTQILTDLLFLVIFADMEIDQEQYSLKDFDGPQIYSALLDLLRQYQMMQWLATHSRPDPKGSLEGTTNDSAMVSGTPSTSKKGGITTVLENLFAVDTKPQSYAHRSQCETTTGNIEDLLRWVVGGNDPSITLDSALVNIQCDLLRNNNIDLASSFLLFQPSTAWATYIRARLCIFRNEFTEAAIYFKKAAYNLSRPDPHINYTLASASLLSPLSASLLATGLPNYYTHILSLFEPLRAHTQTIQFAQLALQFLPTATSSQGPHPPATQRSDLLARLFHAALAIPDFPAAYATLIRYSDPALQRNALRSLVADMVRLDSVDEFLALPFAGLKSDVDAVLAEGAARELGAPSATAAAGVGAVPYYKILYAWRLGQGNARGAAAVLVERIEARNGRRGERKGIGGGGDALLEEYLVVINALSLVGGDEGWVLVGGVEAAVGGGAGGRGGGGGDVERRKVVTLGDVRRGYQEELDRRSVLAGGRFGIVGTGEEDEEDEGEGMDVG